MIITCKWVLSLPKFKISALCGHHGLHTRPKAVTKVSDVDGPLHLHLGLHGDKVHVCGGTSSGIDWADRGKGGGKPPPPDSNPLRLSFSPLLHVTSPTAP